MLRGLTPVVGSTAGKFRWFSPLDFRIERLHCRLHITTVECGIRVSKGADRLSYLDRVFHLSLLSRSATSA